LAALKRPVSKGKEGFLLIDTIRRDMNYVHISVADKVFLMRLFGHSMANVHGLNSQKRWKKLQIRIFSAIKKAVKNNFQSDGFHTTRVRSFLEKMDKACISKDNTDPKMILALVGIVFELLGEVPNYSDRRILNRNDDYFLSGLRGLYYSQTHSQKIRTIIEAARYKPYCDYHKSDDLYEVLDSQYHGDVEGFLEWYKKEYPKVYCELF
jgi:hypothetical protein